MEKLKKKCCEEEAVLTSLQRELKRHLEEQVKSEVISCLEDLKRQFRSFEEAYDLIHNQLEDIDEILQVICIS